MAQAPSMGRTLLDKGEELREQYVNLVEQRAANRKTLRDLEVQGLLTEDEAAEALELYPPRRTAEEIAAEAEAQGEGE